MSQADAASQVVLSEQASALLSPLTGLRSGKKRAGALAARFGAYVVPEAPGYSIEMHPESIASLRYPDGAEWR